MPTVHFLGDYTTGKVSVCRKLTEAVASVILLPEEVQIRFINMGQSVYGSTSIDGRFKNRVSINTILTVSELPGVLVHELIHLHQMHMGWLDTTRGGTYVWHGRTYSVDVASLTHDQYHQLPWEQDVDIRHAAILRAALIYALNKGN